MMLVDNFKVILLVVLICAAGLQSTEALKCVATNDSTVTCETGKCNVDKDFNRGCGTDGCKSTKEMYCCDTDECNDEFVEVCRVSPKIIGCKEYREKLGRACKNVTEGHNAQQCKEWKDEGFIGGDAETTGDARHLNPNRHVGIRFPVLHPAELLPVNIRLPHGHGFGLSFSCASFINL